MKYFTEDCLQFLTKLEKNNNRDWFNTNKKWYKESVEKPFIHFIDAVIDAVSPLNPHLSMTAKEGVFRIYKDTRFSKDKTPYKTHLSAVVCKGGRKGKKVGGIYFELKATSFKIYSGFYMPERGDLQLVREAITSKPAVFQSLIEAPNFKKTFGEVLGDKNKRIPKEFKAAAEKQALIMNKSFYYFNELPAETIFRDDLMELVLAHYRIAQPLGNFFMKAIEY